MVTHSTMVDVVLKTRDSVLNNLSVFDSMTIIIK